MAAHKFNVPAGKFVHRARVSILAQALRVIQVCSVSLVLASIRARALRARVDKCAVVALVLMVVQGSCVRQDKNVCPVTAWMHAKASRALLA